MQQLLLVVHISHFLYRCANMTTAKEVTDGIARTGDCAPEHQRPPVIHINLLIKIVAHMHWSVLFVVG
jgi:hypothetical protein